MNERPVAWLYDELPGLVSMGILSADDADRLRQHYGPVAVETRRNLGLAICAILGSTLIGLGTILLFAHNWDDLSRPARTVLSFTPLVLGQILVGWTLTKRLESIPWREGSALFLMAGIGCAIALIGQTYHIPGNMGAFLLTWMLLSVPLVYLVDASVPGALYWVGLTAWAGFVQDEGGQAVLFWPLAAVMAPHLWNAIRKDPYGFRAVALTWSLGLCLCVATGITLEKETPGLWIVVYSGLFATSYLLGHYAFASAPRLWQRPLHVLGAAGVVVVGLILTFEDPWEDIGWSHARHGAAYHQWAAIGDCVLAIGLLAASAVLLTWLVRKKRFDTVPFGLAGLVSLLGFALVAVGTPEEVGMILFNAYLFALGIIVLALGIHRGELATVNGGLLILAALIVTRFFDLNLSFTLRGIAFIAIGAGFLSANLLVRRKGEIQ